jgi:hypothetical protein
MLLKEPSWTNLIDEDNANQQKNNFSQMFYNKALTIGTDENTVFLSSKKISFHLARITKTMKEQFSVVSTNVYDFYNLDKN